MADVTFVPWPKTPRLFRNITVSEKIDGSNASVLITDGGEIRTGSKSRWITPKDDNFGFAAWVEENRDELLQLGPGHHFGEWWGRKIQRGYEMQERRFSLFNTRRWVAPGHEPQPIPNLDPTAPVVMQSILPPCVDLVPVLFRGPMDTQEVNNCLDLLRISGSQASPGYMTPEGVVVYHAAANMCFKVTIERDHHIKSTPLAS